MAYRRWRDGLPDLPAEIKHQDLLDELSDLGIPTDGLVSVAMDRKAVVLTYHALNAEGKLFAAGDNVATNTFSIPLTYPAPTTRLEP